MKPNYIPTSDSPEDVYLRRAIIVERLSRLIGKTLSCAAFPGKQVEVNGASIDETATRASRRYLSTLAALRLPEALKKAQIVNVDQTHSNKQRKMGFVKIYILRTALQEIGNVKIVVGERKNKRIVHYCITQKK
mgnify:CR=1 FL=1